MAEVSLKELLIQKGLAEKDASKFALYVANAKSAEANKEPNQRPVSNNSPEQLIALAVKFNNMGILIDGVEAVITGRNMAMVTFNGYKNKVLRTYPETMFDIQLVREGDKFSFSKDSGHVQYHHEIGDPFDQESHPIVGAYVVFKNKRGEFLELLNKTDYEEMKKASKQSYLWGQWESEFWLKSVIKRAAKRHFYDVVAEIDRNDNEDYGIIAGDPPPPKEDEQEIIDTVIQTMTDAQDLAELRRTFTTSGYMNNKKVVEAYNSMKEMLAEPGEDLKPVGKQGVAKVTDDPETTNEVEPEQPPLPPGVPDDEE